MTQSTPTDMGQTELGFFASIRRYFQPSSPQQSEQPQQQIKTISGQNLQYLAAMFGTDSLANACKFNTSLKSKGIGLLVGVASALTSRIGYITGAGILISYLDKSSIILYGIACLLGKGYGGAIAMSGIFGHKVEKHKGALAAMIASIAGIIIVNTIRPNNIIKISSTFIRTFFLRG